MELIVFDLDGTLLNSSGQISQYSKDTLAELSHRGIAYTVATGRSLHASRDLLQGQGFRFPQVFKNGVMIWNPKNNVYSHQGYLNPDEVKLVLEAALTQQKIPTGAGSIFTMQMPAKAARLILCVNSWACRGWSVLETTSTT